MYNQKSKLPKALLLAILRTQDELPKEPEPIFHEGYNNWWYSLKDLKEALQEYSKDKSKCESKQPSTKTKSSSTENAPVTDASSPKTSPTSNPKKPTKSDSTSSKPPSTSSVRFLPVNLEEKNETDGLDFNV